MVAGVKEAAAALDSFPAPIDFKYNTPYSFLLDHFAIAFLFRIVLVIYGEFHDQVFRLNYTDIDYKVFSDAAQWVSLGKSPYNRDGYRYTPLLSYFLLPNLNIHPAFGKVLFVLLDIFAAFLTFQLLKRMKIDEHLMKLCMLVCLYNPVTINVTTRGNAESIMSVLTLATLLLHMEKRFLLSGLLFGISVHFKIYPICYALPMYFWCGLHSSSPRPTGKLLHLFLPTRDRVVFVMSSFFAFALLTGIFYFIYGKEFLQETYFYHLSRRDVQHNFSPYFYILRVAQGSVWENWVNVLPFLSQAVFWVVFSVKFYPDLPFVCFLNTAAFVILNKVCTVQYFVWYLTFLPLIIPKIQLSRRRLIFLISSWFASMGFWLGAAYFWEFQRYEILLLVWLASLTFAATNLAILFSIITEYNFQPTLAFTNVKKLSRKTK